MDVQLCFGEEASAAKPSAEDYWHHGHLMLKNLSPRFEELYAKVGRPSIALQKLLRDLLLWILYSVRSRRLLIEQLDYNLMFCWLAALTVDDSLWEGTVFSKNRDGFLEGEIARAFLEPVLIGTWQQRFLADEHFTVHGTRIEAWTGQKSFKRSGIDCGSSGDDPGTPAVDFREE